ncbi:MAG: hypothetical protein KF773_29345 [Deltaproteobacteria bacterium]|nr:hypothetical protein [Deltaproteobacteria bacterium]
MSTATALGDAVQATVQHTTDLAPPVVAEADMERPHLSCASQVHFVRDHPQVIMASRASWPSTMALPRDRSANPRCGAPTTSVRRARVSNSKVSLGTFRDLGVDGARREARRWRWGKVRRGGVTVIVENKSSDVSSRRTASRSAVVTRVHTSDWVTFAIVMLACGHHGEGSTTRW